MFKIEIKVEDKIIQREVNDIYDVMAIINENPGYTYVKVDDSGKKLVKRKDNKND